MTTILVIEDDELIREILVQLLESHNFRMLMAEDGYLGVQVAIAELPDLILCDVQMPGIDGYEVLQILRQNLQTATIPFIFLTAQDGRADIRRGMELGADDYLIKPFTVEELLAAIASRLSKREIVTQYLTERLYQAQAQSNDRVQENPNGDDTLSPSQLAMQAALHKALVEGQLQIHYQPQVDLAGHIIGAEALLRWQNSQGEMVSPAEFIPLAETTGLIVPIGEWVLLNACTQAAQWIATGAASFRVSVNLSERQLSEPNLSQYILDVLETTGLKPSNLVLEVTESTFRKNDTVPRASLSVLKACGIQIAIDDFGKGYASLGYLKKFPFDIIKISPSFIKDVSSDPQNTAITRAVIYLAHSLDLTVIAQGVETEAEFKFLKEYQCDLLQGTRLGYPKPGEEFENFLTFETHVSAPAETELSNKVISLWKFKEREISENFLNLDWRKSVFNY